MNGDTANGESSNAISSFDLTSGALDYDPDSDNFFDTDLLPSFGAQGGFQETEDDEDEDTGDLEGEDEDGEVEDLPPFKKT
jgi:hypothetical protein